MWHIRKWLLFYNVLQNNNISKCTEIEIYMNVLIIDDDDDARQELETAFRNCIEMSFNIEKATDASKAEEILRKVKYDVITIDLKLGGAVTAGLQLMERQMILASCPEAVKIVVTAYPTYPRCVKAMRLGAWDFIDKDSNYGAEVVGSAVARLKELEEIRREERYIFEEWLPSNERQLQEQYSDQYVAVSNGKVIANGPSMIALGAMLAETCQTEGRLPYILRIAKRKSHD